jgi:hypothetical protein
MLDKIIVKKTANPENGYNSKEQLRADTLQHLHDVGLVMASIGMVLIERGYNHDWSKLEFFDDFSKDTLERLDTPDFKERDWYHIHTVEERHHINANVPTDVDFIDIIEMIVDCIIAGKTRSDDVNKYFLILKDDILDKAYWNTVDKIDESIIVSDNNLKKYDSE